jgi:hypothetical protein
MKERTPELRIDETPSGFVVMLGDKFYVAGPYNSLEEARKAYEEVS